MAQITIHNDEPSRSDRLNRGAFAKALASVALTADTPLVIGL